MTLTLSAKLGARVQSVFPNVSATFGTMLNRLLPAPTGSPSRQQIAHDVESAATRSVWTTLSDRAAAKNNESG